MRLSCVVVISEFDRHLTQAMDFKSFSDESFDQISWINGAFSNPEAKSSSRESYTSNMVYKLQLFIQEINGSLEETAQQVISTLPRLLKEVEALEDDARAIKTELAKARKNLNPDRAAIETVERLTRMHAIKEKMELYYKSAHDLGVGNDISESEATSKGSENIDEIVARINALNQQLLESGESVTSSPDIMESSAKGSDEGKDSSH